MTDTMTKSTGEREMKLENFYREAEQKHFAPSWPVTAELLPPEAKTKVKPFLWRWSDLRPMMYRASASTGSAAISSSCHPGLGMSIQTTAERKRSYFRCKTRR